MSQDGVGAPATRLQRTIAGVWQEVLELDALGVDEDFFELGGDSLAAVRMLAAIEDLLLAQVSFVDFLDQPTVAALAEAVEQARGQARSASPVLERRPVDGPVPCTFAQERLWFVDQLAESTGAYNEHLGTRIRGRIDADALEYGLREIVQRHEALRTSFMVVDGTPMQVVHDVGAAELERIDLSGTSDPEAELRRVTQEFVARPFDLARAPLMRAALVGLAPEDHVLQLVFHHNVSDGLSHVVVLRELAELYRARAGGHEPSLAEPPLQYADFARWQRERLSGEALEQAIAPWRERLADIPAAIDLPTDHPRPPISSHGGATRHSKLDARTSERIRTFARAQGATAFATLLAVFDVVLARYAGQDTIMVGSATAGRDRPELADVVGMFANTIVLRNDVSGDPTFRELLGRVGRTVLDAVAHQDAPFERLVAELQQQPDLSRHPIFQVFFSMRPHARLDLPGAEPYNADPGTARADLTLWVEETTAGYELEWEYSTDLFEPSTIDRFERHFLRLLDAALEHPDLRIGALPMLEASEREQLLEQSRPVHPDYPVACMHQLFEQQAMLRPDAPAVVFGGASLTYRELNERANQLAQRLRELGIGPESMVGLFLERSFDLVVAILAVLKAGGAYVPLDPESPAARVAFVLGDTAAPVLLTQKRLVERLPEHGAGVICLDADDLGLERLSPENPAQLTTPENLAYVIYTSGSTGQPKGVQVEHRQIARLFTATEHWYGFGPADVWVLAHSYAFDVSVWELWGALAHGGRIVVSPFWVTRSPEAFATLVAEQGVTVLCATPSLFSSVQDELLRHADELAIRYVVFAGEALQPASLRPWFDRFGDGGAALVNMYGITETTVHSTYRVMRAADCERDASPVGVPIPDLSLYLLDAYGEPVPPGVAGEIYVGGEGVTRGYLNRPEMNGQRFLQNPFAPGRLYRSGDLARRLSDGEIGFLGRMDDQVKIRGFRIELGEIKSVIEEHEAVAESAVIAAKVTPEDVRLAAYVVPDEQLAAPVRRILRLEREKRLSPDQLFELPDGTAVAHVNPTETEFVYGEIFTRADYFKHGIELPEDACVVDAGANIGLFALLVARHAPGARILAFEPMPEVHSMLGLNGAIHGLDLTAFDCALGAFAETATFTYFPHATLLSGRAADTGADAAVVRQMLTNLGEADPSAEVEEVIEDRLESIAVQRQVRALSEVLHEQGVGRVDLLKIDVEGAELDVLAGIDDDDWPKIHQVVMEVHGGADRLRAVTEVLTRVGFEVAVEEDELLHGSGLYDVFARRPTAVPAAILPGPVPVATSPQRPQQWRSITRLRESLRAALEDRLPGYMVPSSITFVEELPLTTNGKLDRRALPAPGWVSQRESAFVAPRTPTEELIAGMWREIIGVDRVGADDNFFQLGGHSLLAARVVARVREALGAHVSVRLLFEHPTLSAFAARLDQRPATASVEAAAVVADRAGAPLSFQQEALLFFDALDPGSRTYNAPLATRISGPLQRSALEHALSELVARHEALRTVIATDGSAPSQVVLEDVSVPLSMVELTEQDLPARMESEAARPFDLARDPLLRATLFRLADDEHVLLLQSHHIVLDAWAVAILHRDVSELYSAALSSRPPALPPLGMSYREFARWQRGRLSGELLGRALDFWRAHLAAAPAMLALPTDHRRPAEQTFDGATHRFELPAELAQAVRETCEREHVTPYMLLMAAFATLLYRLSGDSDILLGGPMVNRDHPELENLLGFCANTVVVRARLAGNPTFSELLVRVRDSVLASYEHQEVPLELVVDAVRPERLPGVNPLFQVNFRVSVGAPPMLSLAGASTRPVQVDLGHARFDLALELHVLDDRIEAEFNWNTALFERATLERIAEDFQGLLTQVTAEPSRRLLELEIAEGDPGRAAEQEAVGSIRGFRAGSR